MKTLLRVPLFAILLAFMTLALQDIRAQGGSISPCPFIFASPPVLTPHGPSKWKVEINVRNTASVSATKAIEIICANGCFQKCEPVTIAGNTTKTVTFGPFECATPPHVTVNIYPNTTCIQGPCDTKIITLPIKILSFEAERVGRDAKLVWTIAQENLVPGSYFMIERDSKVIDSIPVVVDQNRYVFTDRTVPSHGSVAYRIAAVEDGKKNYSKIVTVNFSDHVIYHVKMGNTIFIKNVSGAMICLFDERQRIVRKVVGESISLEGLARGMYVVSVAKIGEPPYRASVIVY